MDTDRLAERLEERLSAHIEQDRLMFEAINDTLKSIDQKLDVISERTIRLEVMDEVYNSAASKAGAISGSKWSAVVAIVVSGVFQACQWLSGQSQ